MASYSGSCEIVEAREESRSVRNDRGAYQSHMGSSFGGSDRSLKIGHKDSPDDDINQLFEAITLRNSKVQGLSSPAGTSTSSLRRNAMKRPITVSGSHASGFGNSEQVSLKQALRDLCISKASEMAAMKRLSQSINSPRISEAERIKSLYNSVVETGRSSPSLGNSKGTMAEISLAPEESKLNSSHKMPQEYQVPRVKSSSQSAHSSPRFQGLKSPNQSAISSPRFGAPVVENATKITSVPNESVCSSRTLGSQILRSPNQSTLPSPRSVAPKTQNAAQNCCGTASIQNDNASISTKVGSQKKEKATPAAKLTCSNSIANAPDPDIDQPTIPKKTSKASVPRSGRKVRLHAAPVSSTNGNRVSKLTRSTPRTKQPIRNRTYVKKKVKQGTVGASRISNGGNRSLVPGTGQLVCQKCQCALKNPTEYSNQDFLGSSSANLTAEVSSSSVNSGVCKPKFTSSTCNESRDVGKAKNSKSRKKEEFSQSSKSSEFSTSTSNSDESNASRPSCGNRPHMSKDFRWQAIQRLKMQDGVLSLGHFNLLKKLGCGDIGTVYLAELIGSNCLFAIKVMDNEFLERRKKMPRAQTEREILRMLDHPFLPTLYAQFTSDNLSCLVMEYCPGGDLHVLRQKQFCRCFPEPAARFYVAEVLLALEYLHMLGVIYRDLKPENILVREDGHIMLTDFDLSLRCSVNPTLLKSPSSDPEPGRMSGPCTETHCMEPFCVGSSCQVTCFGPRFLPAAAKARKIKAEAAVQVRSLPQLVAEPTDARSNSFVGTHEYLAPEIIKGGGHGAAVDWWTFGVFLYELLYGITPFKGHGNEETLANVISQSLRFPDSPLVSFQARDLIRGLLVKEPENRLGSEKGAAEIKQHPFFEGLNWALIRCAIPPELPESYDFEVVNSAHHENSKYLELKANTEHLEFELF